MVTFCVKTQGFSLTNKRLKWPYNEHPLDPMISKPLAEVGCLPRVSYGTLLVPSLAILPRRISSVDRAVPYAARLYQ